MVSLSSDWALLSFEGGDDQDAFEEEIDIVTGLSSQEEDPGRVQEFLDIVEQPVVDLNLLREKAQTGIPKRERPRGPCCW